MKAHLDLERTTYLVYGLMEADEKVQADTHVSDCPACADAVRRLAEERDLVLEATGTPAPREEMVRSIVAQVYDRAVATRRARVRSYWMLGCAAGAFLAIGLVFLSRTRELPEPHPAVALDRISVQRGEFWVDQSKGYVPTPGDRIRTDDVAGATIQLEEGSKFQITRGSMVEFRGNRGPTAVLRLLEGEVGCDVVPDPRPFTVEAAGATVTVVGTEFAVHLLDDQPFFKPEKRIPRPPKVGMLVTSGAVLFRTTEGEPLRVPAGWIALAGTKGAPWLWGDLKDLANDKVFEKRLKRTPVAKPAVDAGPGEAGWQDRTDAAVRAHVDAVPWTRWADALVRDHKEKDAAVMEQRPLRAADPDDKNNLEFGWGKIDKLAKELRLNGNIIDACRNKLASGLFIEAVVEALSGSPLTEEQRKRLLIPATIDNLVPVYPPGSTTLEKWKVRADRTLLFARQLKEILTEDGYRRVTRNIGPSFLADGYRVWVIEAEKEAEAADRLMRIWGEQFQLPTYAQAPLATIAAQHVRSHREAQEKFRREALTGVEELELSARLFDLQARAERQVSEIPALHGETRVRAAAGSQTLFWIKFTE